MHPNQRRQAGRRQALARRSAGQGAGSNHVLVPLEVRGNDRLEGLGVVVSHRHSVTATAPKPRPPSAGAFVTPAGRRGVPAFPAAASGC